MRHTILIGCVAFVFVARGVVACGGDDTTDADASNDATTNQDAPTKDTGSDVKSPNDASDAIALDTGSDAGPSDANDASSIDATDATLDASDSGIIMSDAMGSCVDGGIACPGTAPCCTNLASVNYGKCVIINLCK
jgi:hypothetical protein